MFKFIAAMIILFSAQSHAGFMDKLKGGLGGGEAGYKQKVSGEESSQRKAKIQQTVDALNEYNEDATTCQKKSSYIDTICANVATLARKLCGSFNVPELCEINDGDAAYAKKINVRPILERVKGELKTAGIEDKEYDKEEEELIHSAQPKRNIAEDPLPLEGECTDENCG